MIISFLAQVSLMAVSLGLGLPRTTTDSFCKAADFPVIMVLYRCALSTRPCTSSRLTVAAVRPAHTSTASIVYETFLFSLMVFGVLIHGKDGLKSMSLLEILVRDGTVAFVGVFRASRISPTSAHAP